MSRKVDGKKKGRYGITARPFTVSAYLLAALRERTENPGIDFWIVLFEQAGIAVSCEAFAIPAKPPIVFRAIPAADRAKLQLDSGPRRCPD